MTAPIQLGGLGVAAAGALFWLFYYDLKDRIRPEPRRLLIVAFVLVHTLIDHKEDRFLFPIVPLWFVFIGHGAPARDGQDGLLVGFDAQQKARSLSFSKELREIGIQIE